jgi:hypothetical protein
MAHVNTNASDSACAPGNTSRTARNHRHTGKRLWLALACSATSVPAAPRSGCTEPRRARRRAARLRSVDSHNPDKYSAGQFFSMATTHLPPGSRPHWRCKAHSRAPATTSSPSIIPVTAQPPFQMPRLTGRPGIQPSAPRGRWTICTPSTARARPRRLSWRTRWVSMLL